MDLVTIDMDLAAIDKDLVAKDTALAAIEKITPTYRTVRHADRNMVSP
jgi:hypothetical protein